MPNWDIFAQFGIAGLILGVFFCMFMFVMRSHSETIKGIVSRMSGDHTQANEAWRETFTQYANQADQRQGETNIVLREMTNIIAEANVHHNYRVRICEEVGERRRAAEK